MSRVVFIDANIPIYAAGRDHPYKEPCARIFRMIAENPARFVTSAEVLQELVHHYMRSGRWGLGREVLKGFAELMHGRIEPVSVQDVLIAADLADGLQGVSARDLFHAAVMRRLETTRLISADRDFDQIDGIERLDPTSIEEWIGSIQPDE